ncbi:hypothetical protein K466DRAFT_599244 [Polyporus arcularius HHB13444]|uniref:Uncharacterized protein n=1 Tax=Polyporus arcularius HHB13444 TaxID=1314778 RepID=A0A5C3PP19_9APHY|nr:hypothetical protein K466DRAFT_599244 [Polyporus arcularius HHB13444]
MSLHVLPVRPSSTMSTSATLPPPIDAFGGVRGVDPGSTTDRYHAAIQRHRPANTPRARTQVASTPPPLGAGPGPGVLQLHPDHASPPADGRRPSAAGSANSAGATSLPVAPSGSSANPDYETFSCCFWPFAHPAFGRSRSKWPRRTFNLTDWSFGKAVESLEHWGLLFTVTLPRNGSVYRTFGHQVVAQLTANDIVLPGYDATRPWRSPLDLPFVLLSSTGRTTKIHAPFDGFNELTYTVSNIHAAKPSLTVIKCPIGEEFMKHTFLRLFMADATCDVAPRFGDLLAPLANHPAYVLGAPGLRDFMSIRGAELPHPCFPFRILSEAVEDVSSECRPDCPSSAPTSPALAPVAGPSSRPAPRPRGRNTAHTSPDPPAMASPAPSVAQVASILDEYMQDDRPPSPPTPQSPRSFLRAGCPPTAAIPPLFLDDTELPMADVWVDDAPPPQVPATVTDVHAAVAVDTDPVSMGPPASAPVPADPPARRGRRRSQRSARMTTGSRPPRATVVLHDDDEYVPEESPEPEASTSHGRGVRRTHSDVGSPEVNAASPPSNRRRVSSPAPQAAPSALDEGDMQDVSLNDHVPIFPPCRTEPLAEISKADLVGWAERVIAAIPRGALSSSGLRPHIRAQDPKEAASMLIFLIQWLFTHSPTGPITSQKRRAFQEAFAREFSYDKALCELIPLSELLRHARHMHIEIDEAIGDSPIRAVMRNMIYLLVGQHRYWQSRGRYDTIRWFGRREARVERDATLRTAGFGSLLHSVVLLVGPDPISPFLLLLALLGRAWACRVDEAFMSTVDDGLLACVEPWRTLDITQPLPQEAAHPLIVTDRTDDAWQPEHYGTDPLSPEDIDAIEQDLVSSLVFGGRQIADDPDMHAFTEGFFAAHPDRLSLIATFKGNARDYLANMFNKRLDSVQVLLDHIDFASGVDQALVDLTSGGGIAEAEWDRTFESEFELALAFYMQQAGHPDDDGIRKLVGDGFDSAAHDPLLRARMFLTIMSGSDLLPAESEWKIKIAFRHIRQPRPNPPSPSGAGGPIPAARRLGPAVATSTLVLHLSSARTQQLDMQDPTDVEEFLLQVQRQIRAVRAHVADYSRVVGELYDPWASGACAAVADQLYECSLAIDTELDFVHRMLHGSPRPSEDPLTDIEGQEGTYPSECDDPPESESQDYPAAEEPIPDPPWVDWFWGDSDDDPWLWRPLGLIEDLDVEPEWPPRDLLELEEAMDMSDSGGGMPWYASQAALEEYLRSVAESLPEGITLDMLT